MITGDEADEGGALFDVQFVADGATGVGVGMEKLGVDAVRDGEELFGGEAALGVEFSRMFGAEDDARGERSREGCAGGDREERGSLGEAGDMVGMVNAPDD